MGKSLELKSKLCFNGGHVSFLSFTSSDLRGYRVAKKV
jgi:hypothetical protein